MWDYIILHNKTGYYCAFFFTKAYLSALLTSSVLPEFIDMSLCFLVGLEMELRFVEENKPVKFSVSKYATFYRYFLFNKGPSNMWQDWVAVGYFYVFFIYSEYIYIFYLTMLLERALIPYSYFSLHFGKLRRDNIKCASFFLLRTSLYTLKSYSRLIF